MSTTLPSAPSKLKLVVFPPKWGMPSLSPFCSKLEIWLRLVGIPYEVETTLAPTGAPKGKLPYVELDGQRHGDSRFVIAMLTERYGVDPDEGLSPRDRALGHAVSRMLEEHLYFVLLQDRWLSDEGWAVLKDSYFTSLPLVVRQLVPPMLRVRVRRDVRGQGTGKLTHEEIGLLGVQDVDALAQLLGDRPYLLGDRPRSVDATAFAFLGGTLWCPIPSPVKDRIEEWANLVDYCDRMRERYFPELGPDVRAAV